MPDDGAAAAFEELTKLRAQLSSARQACERLDRDNRSLRATLKVPKFESLDEQEQDALLEHFLQVRFGSYEDEGEAGWELLRMLTQEPTWTPAVYDRTWAPTSVAEIRALAAETKGSRLASTLKQMCAMHRDYFISAVLVPQPAPEPEPEREYSYDDFEFDPEHELADGDEAEYLVGDEEEMFEYVPEQAGAADTGEEPLEYLLESDEDWGHDEPAPPAPPSVAAAPEEQPSVLIAAAGHAPGVVARWKAVTAHAQEQKEQKTEQFRSVVEAEMARVRAQRELEFGPAGQDAPDGPGSSPSAARTASGSGGGGGGSNTAAEIGAARASWAPDYSGPEAEAAPPPPARDREPRLVVMQAEAIYPYTPTEESSQLLEGQQLPLLEGTEVMITAMIDDDWCEGHVIGREDVVGRFPMCCVMIE